MAWAKASRLRKVSIAAYSAFRSAVSSESFGLSRTLKDSQRLLEATLQRQDHEVAKILELLHDEVVPFFVYHDENSLACVVTLGPLSALNNYSISREEKAGKGYVDFLFTPFRRRDMPILLELKYNHSAEHAIACIKQRGYVNRFKDASSVLLVGINYSEATKKHTCMTEVVSMG